MKRYESFTFHRVLPVFLGGWGKTENVTLEDEPQTLIKARTTSLCCLF